MTELFADGFSTDPYWWDATPPQTQDEGHPPPRADAVVVGAGYTGLHAAIQIARAGRSVVVLEKDGLGATGCSTRNGGQISLSVKPDIAALTRRHGPDIAARIIADGRASRDFAQRFTEDEGIDCDFRPCGRYHAAHSPAAYRRLAASADTEEATLVPRDQQRGALGSDRYHGGVILHAHAALDPGRYHAGLLRVAREAGVLLRPYSPAMKLRPDGAGAVVETARGEISTRDVVLATNGYTGALSPWHRRRVIPIGSYIIATETLDPALVARLIPGNRIVSDSRRVVYYYRASPDGRRILFGGRVSAGETGVRRAALRLHAEMARIFPELRDAKLTHGWMGYVAYSFDEMPHPGRDGPIHHAMGYCGSGVGMAGYLGMLTGRRVAGLDAPAGLGERAFQTRPLYSGRPWFLPAAVEARRLLDRLGV